MDVAKQLDDPIFTADPNAMSDQELRDSLVRIREIVVSEQERHESLISKLTELRALEAKAIIESDAKKAAAHKAKLV